MRGLIVAAALLALATLSSCGDGSDPDNEVAEPVATSTTVPSTEVTAPVEAIVDDFNRSLVDTDPQAAAALFTDDGVFVDKNGGSWIGTAAIVDYVERVGRNITACERTGPVEVVAPGVYTFPVDFTYLGRDFEETVLLTMGDGLIARHEWSTNG